MRRYGINSVGLLMLQSSHVKLITTAECCHQLTLSKKCLFVGSVVVYSNAYLCRDLKKNNLGRRPKLGNTTWSVK